MYFTNISQLGPARYDDVPGSIGVLEEPNNHMSIGQAHCKTWDSSGLTVGEMSVRSQPIAGRWVIIDRDLRRVP
jgi:hypothetical protein